MLVEAGDEPFERSAMSTAKHSVRITVHGAHGALLIHVKMRPKFLILCKNNSTVWDTSKIYEEK